MLGFYLTPIQVKFFNTAFKTVRKITPVNVVAIVDLVLKLIRTLQTYLSNQDFIQTFDSMSL